VTERRSANDFELGTLTGLSSTLKPESALTPDLLKVLLADDYVNGGGAGGQGEIENGR
jgi:hypothetical protein